MEKSTETLPDIRTLIEDIELLISKIESEEEKLEKLLPLVIELVNYFKSTIASFSKEVVTELVEFNKNLDKEFISPVINQTENLINDYKAINNLFTEAEQKTLKQGVSSKTKIINLMDEVDKGCSNLFNEIGIDNPLQVYFANHRKILNVISEFTFHRLDGTITYMYQSMYNFPDFINSKLLPYFKQKKSNPDKAVTDAPYLALALIVALQSYISILDACENNLPATLSGMVGGSVGVEAEGAYAILKPWIVWSPFKVAAEVLVTTISTYADLPE